MPLKREDAIAKITEGIGWLAMVCKYRGAMHLFNTHVVSHEFWCHLLNAIFDLQLQVLDRIKPNFPAIDLGDAVNKQCFQITAEKGTDKIQHTLDKYVQHGLEPQYGKLRLLVIGDRQGSYDGLRVPSSLSFVWEDDILDITALVKIIEALDTSKLEGVTSVMSEEVKIVQDQQPAKSPLEPQLRCEYEGFHSVQVNFGVLYKLRFQVQNGDPGECCCEISADGHTSFAKWDETPNPLHGDRQVGLCSWLLALKVLANLSPGPSPFLGERGNHHLAHSGALPWQWGRGVIARANLADLYAQGSWAEGSSAFALPFLLGDELKQDLVSSSRRTMTSG